MTARAYIPLKEKLAAVLATMLRDDGTGKLVPAIPYADRKRMTADQVLSLFQWHHYPIRKVDNGPDVHWNLEPHFIRPHREITAKVDVPQIRKGDRLRDSLAAFNARIAAKVDGEQVERPRSRFPQGRKLRSRPFQRQAPRTRP